LLEFVQPQIAGAAMLLRAEDDTRFNGHIEQDGAEIWASYRIDGRVKGEPVSQSDRRMFASELEARNWLVGEAEKRGFHDFEPELRTPA
jgi:hypothetical protein